MCNAVCVGLAQFFGPIILAVALVAMVGAFVSAIRNTIAEDRRRNRAALEHKRRLRHDLTRPLIEVEQARHRLHEEDKSYVLDGDFSRKSLSENIMRDCIVFAA